MNKMRVLVATLAIMLIVLSCVTDFTRLFNPTPTPKNTTPTPTFAIYTTPGPSRPPLLIQFCNDDTGSYPRSDFNNADQKIASSLENAVTANQQGVTLYATAITHNTFDPSNTLSTFTILPSPVFAPTPSPIPITHLDPFTDPPSWTAIAKQNEQAIYTYNGTATAEDQQIQTNKTAITNAVKKLTSWNPPVDDIATSILGCFQLAAQRFVGQPGVKMIYIASDLENNTDVDYTQNFVKAHSLAGVIVHVIYFYSQDAGRNYEKEHAWCPYLKSAGASNVLFSDPGQSGTLTDMFDHD